MSNSSDEIQEQSLGNENSPALIEPRRLTQQDKQIIESANEILNSFEHVHRTDLTLHLYSSYLLKKLLYRANEKKHFYEIDQFIKTQIKDNWVSWPNPNVVINPQTDKIYGDLDTDDNLDSSNIEPTEISDRALQHATNMLNLEFSGHWQHLLSKSSMKSGQSLDIDKLNIPTDISNSILYKLDHLLAGLHHKVAKQNKIVVSKDKQGSPELDGNLNSVQIENGISKVNKKIRLDYHDIIERGCQMNENMDEIYMKSLELFNDIPSKFKKDQFKLAKKVLKKYRHPKRSKKATLSHNILKNYKEDYIAFSKLLADGRLSTDDKNKMKILNKQQTEIGLNTKTFFQVKGYKPIQTKPNQDNSISNIPTSPSRRPKLKRKSIFSQAYQNESNESDCCDMDDYITEINDLK